MPGQSVGVAFQELPSTGEPALLAAQPGPELASRGYAESEHTASGSAVRYSARAVPRDGRLALNAGPSRRFDTRVVVRRPVDPDSFSGTVVVEWLNVSSGQDAAPSYVYLAEEIVRAGHAWVGISAQYVGVMGRDGVGFVDVEGLSALRSKNAERYGQLFHPGDAYAYDIFTEVTRSLTRAESAGPLSDLGVTHLLAVGQSQAAFLLTTYINGVQPRARLFDGFLVHSRAGAAAPLGGDEEGMDVTTIVKGPPTQLRSDLDVPVIVVQTETDLFGYFAYLGARQPDGAMLRVWEVAGNAHADKYQIGEFEELLGCADPVNRGQQRFVLRAALRHLVRWMEGGLAAPKARAIEVDHSAVMPDDNGNARGGLRTPCVEVPTQVLSGAAAPRASYLCRLFGSSHDLAPTRLRALYPSVEDYLARYERAIDTAVAEGFVVAEDRAEILGDANPDLVRSALN